MISLTAWSKAGLPVPVIEGARPDEACSLADLAAPATYDLLFTQQLGSSSNKRLAALALLHRAIDVVTHALLAPVAFDGVALDVAPSQLGMVLDEALELKSVWVGEIRAFETHEQINQLGRLSVCLLMPVMTQSAQKGGVSVRGLVSVMLDALIAYGQRASRDYATSLQTGWVEQLVIGAGYPHHKQARPIYVQVDAGPPVEWRMPRTCCVMNTTPGPHACPSCPQYPDDATRVRKILEYLRGLDAEQFRRVTGRWRLEASP